MKRSSPRPQAPTVELSTPLAKPDVWTFAKGSGSADVTHQTWHGARAIAAVRLQCEPDELTLVESPL